MNENRFKTYLLDYLYNYGWFIQAIESRTTGNGIPDSVVCKDSHTLFIETKLIHCTWPTTHRPVFQNGQLPWMHDYIKHGGRAVVASKLDNGYLFASSNEYDVHTGKLRDPDTSCSRLYVPQLSGVLVSDWLFRL
jgi:hypothetical protein